MNMKRLNVFLILFFLILTNGYTQENSSTPEIRLSYIAGSLGSVSQTYAMTKFGASQTSFLSGYDLKMVFPTRRENIQWLLGTFYQDGAEGTNNTLVGSLYFGPQLSTHFKYVNFLTYISAGLFYVSDESLVLNQNTIVYNSISKYTAPGTKSGLGVSFSYKRLKLTGGYQLFITSGNNHTVAYHGVEVGVGVEF